MDPQKKKKIIISAAIGIAIVAIAIVVWKWSEGGTGTGGIPASESSLPISGITHVTFNRSAYEIALARAAEWQPDAALIKMVVADSAGNKWDFTFVSLKAKGNGFEVVVDGQDVVSAETGGISGRGTALPTNVISPDEAMATAHGIPGYGDAKITSVELLYNNAAHQWYWGIETSTGITLTIKATP